jgi:hypothetical protein
LKITKPSFKLYFLRILQEKPAISAEFKKSRNHSKKGVTREMANAMYLAGFDVKRLHMTDLILGRETLEDIQFIGAVGGFSNSDVWALPKDGQEHSNITKKQIQH